jgi:hypothetical protein
MLHWPLHEREESSNFGWCRHGKYSYHYDVRSCIPRNEWSTRNSHISSNRGSYLKRGINPRYCNYLLESRSHYYFPNLLAHHTYLDEDRLNSYCTRSRPSDITICKRVHSWSNPRPTHTSLIRLRDALS